jgi:hypothetical protein
MDLTISGARKAKCRTRVTYRSPTPISLANAEQLSTSPFRRRSYQLRARAMALIKEGTGFCRTTPVLEVKAVRSSKTSLFGQAKTRSPFRADSVRYPPRNVRVFGQRWLPLRPSASSTRGYSAPQTLVSARTKIVGLLPPRNIRK